MGDPVRLLVVSGSPRRPSVSEALADGAAAHAERRGDVTVDMLRLNVERVEPFRGFDEEYDPGTLAAVDRVTDADALFLVTPVYNGAYTAALKNLFEFVNYKQLEGRAAALAVSGGGPRGFLSVQSQLQTLMSYFRVHVVPRAVFAERSALREGVPPEVRERVAGAVDAVVRLARSLEAAGLRATPSP